tara:strand:- start:81 stop:284 length:204 start_codon:yes stop_codon:yes gene_type:complete
VEDRFVVVEGVEIIMVDLLVVDLLVVNLVLMVGEVVLHQPIMMALLILVVEEEDVMNRDQVVLVEVE